MDESRERKAGDLTGQFLISGTELVDPNFFRTVVLLIQHAADGAMGLVVNRPADVELGSIIEISDGPVAEIPVFVGGPVEQQYLFVLHSGLTDPYPREQSINPAPGIFFEPATDPLIEYLSTNWLALPETDRPEVRFFAGYSGWAPGQLEDELEAGSWFTHDAAAEIVFHQNSEQGWRDALRKKGEFYRIVADTGYTPSMN